MSRIISIIIPCFNAEQFVAEAIESSLGQTYSNKEVIVIDDGSTDDSLDVIKSFGNRIRWETGPNRGACAARNRGIKLAEGDWIQFLDADDLLHPEKLQVQMPERLKNIQQIVYCDHVKSYMDTGLVVKSEWNRDALPDPVLFVLRGALQTSAPIHHRSHLLEVGGFREDLPCAQEWDLHLRIAATGKQFRRLATPLYTIRRRDGSLSADSSRVYRLFPEILWPVYRQLESAGVLTPERKVEFASTLARTARLLLRMGQAEDAHRLFEQARLMHPAGGLAAAYSSRALLLRNIVGPRVAERILQSLRRIIVINSTVRVGAGD